MSDSCGKLLLHNTTLLLFDYCLIFWKYENAEKLNREKKRKIMISRHSISSELFLIINSAVQKELEEGTLAKDYKGSWMFCKMES